MYIVIAESNLLRICDFESLFNHLNFVVLFHELSMAKLNIDITLLDESVLRYGFRALMSGALLDEFKANPVMLLQHNRPKEYSGRQEIMLPIGRWCDIRIDGGRLLAKPEFDDDDEIAVKVQRKVEKGFMNGASVWIDPIETSDEADKMLPGQFLPTATKWGVLEASIVDIPNCKNALAIRNNVGARIELSASANADVQTTLQSLLPFSNQMMDKKNLCAKLGLDDNVTETVIYDKLSALLGAQTQITSLGIENQSLKDEVVRLNAEASEGKVVSLIESAKNAGKIFEGEIERFTKLAKADFATTKELLDGMKAHTRLETQLAQSGNDGNKLAIAELMKLSGETLYREGKLEALKGLDVESFKFKYKEAFGVEFAGV